MTCTADIRCPVCGGPTRKCAGPVGKFAGCVSWPACKGSTNLDGPADEHPIARTYRLALRRLSTRGGYVWTPDERHDAVGDALVAAMRGGWAARPEAWTFVAQKARRALAGVVRDRDKRGRLRTRTVRARTCSRSTASRGIRSLLGAPADIGDDASRRLPPDEWLDRKALDGAPDLGAAIDVSRWCAEMARRGLDPGDPGASVRLALDVLSDWDSSALADEVGAPLRTIQAWRTSASYVRRPRADHAERLVALVQDRLGVG